jgi:hypothetical protein
MKYTLSTGLFAASIVLLLATATPVARAQAGGPYDLTWTTIDAGGGTLTGGAYSLVSTVGQPEPGPGAGGGGYSLTGGVWGGAGAVSSPSVGGQRVYLPMTLRNR